MLAIMFTAGISYIKKSTAHLWLMIFSMAMGLSLSTILIFFTGETIFKTLFITCILFATMALYGNNTKKDLTSMGSFLIVGLIALIISSLVNIFLQSSLFDFALSIVSIIIFTGLTAYDVQRLKRDYHNGLTCDKQAIVGALNLYMNCLLYTSPSPRDRTRSRMPSSA